MELLINDLRQFGMSDIQSRSGQAGVTLRSQALETLVVDAITNPGGNFVRGDRGILSPWFPTSGILV